jgi:hypothetical protein
MATPIVTKDLGINSETGLQEILNVWEVNTSARKELIRVVYEIVTLSPTGVEIKTTGDLEYGRFNHPNNMAFDTWRNSPLGIGIAAAIAGTITTYPDINQNIDDPIVEK